MATVEELARNEMILMGSKHAWDLVRTSKMVCFWNMTDFSFSSMRWSSFLNLHFLHILRILIFLIIIFLFGYFRFKKNNRFLTIFLDFIPYFLDFSRFSLNFFPFRFLVSNYKWNSIFISFWCFSGILITSKFLFSRFFNFHQIIIDLSLNISPLPWQYTESQRQSFLHCSDVNRCLAHLNDHGTVAMGDLRQHILSSIEYKPSIMYCFNPNQNIANYPISMIIDRNFEHRHNINKIIQRTFEAGLFKKWHSSQQRIIFDRSPQRETIRLSVEQISIAFILVLSIGNSLATMSFIVEIFIGRKWRAAPIWVFLEQFFDGKRHYLINLPDRLMKSRELWTNSRTEIVISFDLGVL